MFQGGWTVQKFKLSVPIRSLLGMYKPPHFWFFKGTWVDQAGVNFHQHGRTHTPGKAAKILLFFWVHNFHLAAAKALWRNNPPGEAPGSRGQSHRVPFFLCSTQAGTKRGQGARGTFPTREVAGHSFSPSVLRGREKGVVGGHAHSRAAGSPLGSLR